MQKKETSCNISSSNIVAVDGKKAYLRQLLDHLTSPSWFEVVLLETLQIKVFPDSDVPVSLNMSHLLIIKLVYRNKKRPSTRVSRDDHVFNTQGGVFSVEQL